MTFDYNKLPKLEQKIVFIIFILLALFLLFAGFNQLVSAWNVYRNPLTPNTVSFSGEGKIKVAPDTAKVDIGLVTEGKDTIAVQNENSSKMNAVIKFLKNNGIDEADIKTSSYSLSPKYDYNKGKSTLAGYVLNQGLAVTIRKLDKIGEILDGAVSSGANRVDSVSLFIDKPEELKNKAREEAVMAAKEKASMAAKIAGFRLGRLIGFNEGFSGEPPIFFESLAKGTGGDSAPSPQIEPGTQEIKVNITLTYILK